MARRFRYLLGDSRRERARLAAQARLWDPVAHALFDRLGVRPGWKVLEVGPGRGSLHRELRRRIRGPADAVERSSTFAASLAALARRDGHGAGTLWNCDLSQAPLPPRTYDLVFARWVFLFLPDPGAHLRKLAGALKPGGLLAIEDYQRETWTLVPRPPEWEAFLAADQAFFASQGACGSAGGRLPELYRRAGLEVLETVATVMTGAPGSAVWRWLWTYFVSVADRYAALPPLTEAKVARLRRHWADAGRRPGSAIVAPAVLDVVGRKPRR